MSEQTDNIRPESQEAPQEVPQEPVNVPEGGQPTPPAEEKTDKAPISDKKRTALLRYMAVLFGVAFLLVLLSFLIQIRDSRETISDLNKSNASALQNAVQLQEQNQTLSNAKKELETQLEEQSQEMEDLEEQLADAEDEAEENALRADEENRMRLSYEQLLAALELYNQENYEDCLAILEEEIPAEDAEIFAPAAKTLYDQLLASSREQLEAAETAAEE